MTNIMSFSLGDACNDMDLSETSREKIREAIKFVLEKDAAEKDAAGNARFVSIESNGTLENISTNNSHLVTGGRSDIFEEYDILATIIGTGHHGCVRECLHRATGEKYAVKTIDKNKAPRLDRIRREIELLCSIDHPGIVKMADCYEDDDFVHIVTERYMGGELFDRIVDNTTDHGCLPEGQAAEIIKSLLEAVQYLHSKDIVHRDIKSENVLFESDEGGSSVKLIDFGLSCTHGSNDAPMSDGVGTSYYISPSVLRGEYDRSCDLWAVGVFAYILLCGYPPFSIDYELQASVFRGDLIFDESVWGNLSGTSRDFVNGLLRVDSPRIGTAHEALRHPWVARA